MLKVEVVMLTSRGHPDPGAAQPLGDFDTARLWHNRQSPPAPGAVSAKEP